MAFFSPREKQLARNCSKRTLTKQYHKTEKALQKAVNRGASEYELQSVMDKHHTAEYALLAQAHMKAIKKKQK